MTSDKTIINAKSILSKSNDEYLLVPNCDAQVNELIINLSEEVSVEHIVSDNREDFSASFDEILFYGSSDFPPQNGKWKHIGSIHRPVHGEQQLAVLDKNYTTDKPMIRYMKVQMRGKENNDLYCTLTHVQVYGKSMHLSLKESFKNVN